MLVVADHGRLHGLLNRLAAEGFEPTACPRTDVEACLEATDGEVGYAFVHHPNVDEAEAEHEVLVAVDACAARDVAVGLVLQRIDDRVLRDVVMRHGGVHLPLHEAAVGDVDLEVIRPLLRDNRPGPDAFAIGSLLPMPHDMHGYESQRSLSLVSPSMAAFMTQLRAAVRLMDRTDEGGRMHARPPWDPTDRSPSAAVPANDGRGYELRTARGQLRPNLHDVVLAHGTDAARACLDEGRALGEPAPVLERFPSWRNLPPKLLIMGESGTGKSLVAGLVHDLVTTPPTEPAPFERISCGGLEPDRVQVELFGASEEAHTDAGGRAGALLRASYGTAFFDEIGDLPLDTQAWLLTVLDDLIIHPAGIRPFPGFLQVIAATNRDLTHRTAQQEFRHDLLARFQLRVTVPPLRHRRGELRHLVDFVAQDPTVNPVSAGSDRRAVSHIEADALAMLLNHDYRQGNFRELEEVVTNGLERARAVRSPQLRSEHLRIDDRPTVRPDADTAVVRVKEADAASLAGPDSIEVDGMQELRRLASRRGLPILLGRRRGSAAVVLDGHVSYVVHPDEDGGHPVCSD